MWDLVEALERDQQKYKKDQSGLTERSKKKQPRYGYICMVSGQDLLTS